MSKIFALFFALLFAIGVRGGWLNHRKWAIGMIGRDLSSQNDLRVIEGQDIHDQQTIADYVKEIDRLKSEIEFLEAIRRAQSEMIRRFDHRLVNFRLKEFAKQCAAGCDGKHWIEGHPHPYDLCADKAIKALGGK